MKLHIPTEPKHVKEWIKNVEKGTSKTPNSVDWSSLNVWYGNQLPKYLWGEWKDELKPRGLTWQKFLKLLRQRTDAILMWHKGLCTWDHFIEETIKLIDGPLGQDIARR